MSDDLYAGDVAPREAWKILENDRAAILVDVRTDAEFSYVGVPDLSSLSKETSFVSWQMFPSMSVNPDFAEQVVVINVWGQWCGPCRTEMPELQRVYDATRNEGVAFLGIDVRDNNRQAAVDFIVDRKVTFPSIYDPPMRTMIAFGGRYPTTVIPSTVVLDRQHRVAAVFLRELLAEDLQPVVERLAAEQ